MSRSLNFSDVLESLLPDGSLWQPSEELHSYGTQFQGSVDFSGNLIEGSGSWVDLSPRKDDTLIVTGTTLNNGTYIVAEHWDSADPLKIYVKESLTVETTPATLERQIKAGELKRVLLGSGDNHQVMRDFLQTLAFLRDPQSTPILSDLEKEYGLVTSSATEQERRDRLDAIVYAPAGTGAASYLQAQLQAGGFDVYVYQNSLVTDPGAFYGGPGGEIIANGDAYNRTIAEARKDENLWPMVFFIGGTAHRDASGKIVHIEPAVISDALKPSFKEIVLQVKPVHSWALAVINVESYFTFSVDDTATTDTNKGFANEDATTGGYWYEVGSDYGWVLALIDDTTGAVILDDDTSAALIDG